MSEKKTLLSIIVPLFNEEKTILDILLKLSSLKEKENSIQIIVVNDGSTDRSQEILNDNKNLYDNLIVNSTNGGKGNAVKKALEISEGEYITFQDADLEYDPMDFLKFINLINKFAPDLIIGSRFNYSDYTRSHYIFNKFGNQFITLLFNLIYNTTFTDIYSCYLCFKRSLITPEKLKTNGWEQHAEILAKAVKNSTIHYEVPISYSGRSFEDGKKIKARHSLKVVYAILRYRLF